MLASRTTMFHELIYPGYYYRNSHRPLMPMEAELAALEDRVNTLAMLCQHLRQENQQLRQELAVSRSEGELLTEKINTTKSRLDTLIAKLPLDEAENIE